MHVSTQSVNLEMHPTNEGNSRAKWQTDQWRKDVEKPLEDMGVRFSLEP